jgi:hypothetical protein
MKDPCIDNPMSHTFSLTPHMLERFGRSRNVADKKLVLAAVQSIVYFLTGIAMDISAIVVNRVYGVDLTN